MEDFLAALTACHLCPRNCGVNRLAGQTGWCGAGARVRVGRAALHFWEEPPISGDRGSGTVFFSRCNLRCLYCQNQEISWGGGGTELSEAELAGIFLRLAGEGAHNINLVSPTPYIPQIAAALTLARRQGLSLPAVYNTNSYENPAALRLLSGLVQIFLPDLKYADDGLAESLSEGPGYFAAAAAALRTMRDLAPSDLFACDGTMIAGMIVRHLVLPTQAVNTREALRWIADNLGKRTWVSLMSQYTPAWRAPSHPGLDRTLTADEYRQALAEFEAAGLDNGFCQDLESAVTDFTPDFDQDGLKPAGSKR